MIYRRMTVPPTPPTAEDVRLRIKATARWVKRQAMLDAMLAEAAGG